MSDSYYIDEIRAIRERIARDCGYDLKRILERVRATASKITSIQDCKEVND